jgi:cellulose synthase (UDP-forming)
LDEPARAHRERAQQLRDKALSSERAAREFRRLASLFDLQIVSFERKQFVNLSHESNKAMNLNAYISLMGRSLRIRRQAHTKLIEEVSPGLADLHIPQADYIITLDADSILLPDYALRLVEVIEAPGNQRLAVVQTPYTAVPEATAALERIAGATTDIQHIVHQGFTSWNGTYWVGANALLRRAALEDIQTLDQERGFNIAKYIESRTVIEDTESSIDLINKGWSLYNYPGRLAYSASPPDFGALLIQRRRWANGGLIILPKLARYLLRRPFKLQKLAEVFVRSHYLVSIATASGGVLLLLVIPFERALQTIWLPITALPYFLLYGRDLVRSGYRWLDLPRVYALNLALIPVNLGGVVASLRQAVTGRKSPFARTPKVSDRTAAPVSYLAAQYGLFGWCLFGGTMDVLAGKWLHATFALINAGFLAYAFVRFVGLRGTIADVSAQLRAPAQELADRFRRNRALPQVRRAS